MNLHDTFNKASNYTRELFWGRLVISRKFIFKILCILKYLVASLSRRLTSNSLLGGNFGRLKGSQGRGSVVKN